MSKFNFDCVVFDLDGVVTRTARVHSGAWKIAFDEYMRLREKRDGEPFKEFDRESDYLTYVDGKPRYKGAQSFLESRGIKIEYGDPSDPPKKETICGIGNRKNEMFNEVLNEEGAEIFASTVDFIKRLKDGGVKIGVASSSKNCQKVLRKTGLEELFETRVDGMVSAGLGLTGKPEGDIFVQATHNLGTDPSRAVVVEDATSGVQAGRNGGFGLVLGIARQGNEDELLANGADAVVRDMAEINVPWIEAWFNRAPRDFFESWKGTAAIEGAAMAGKPRLNPRYSLDAKSAILGKKKLVFFLDYDGTLTPIVSRPDEAFLSDSMRATLEILCKKHTVAIVSGRFRDDVENFVKLSGIFYAGSHGMDIKGPGFEFVHPKAKEARSVVDELIAHFHKELGDIEGALVEEKKFSVAVHYRLVDEGKYLARIQKTVEEAVGRHEEKVRLMHGKKVFEIQPRLDWNKGRAALWLLEELGLDAADVTPVYIGDDITDEDAFRALKGRGVGVLVELPDGGSGMSRKSAADYRLDTPDEAEQLLGFLRQCCKAAPD